MKLLLHIGSHKTASTSIQHFCALNRDVLAQQGYSYPRSRHSAYVLNFLASQIALGKEKEAETFLVKAKAEAEAMRCHTLVVSAESFYAMTGFFRDFQGRERPEDYWINEKNLIEKIKGLCSPFESVKIVCYLRPQDEFASSLYNQFVKNVVGTDKTFGEFVDWVPQIFDYGRHLKLWEESFGKEAVVIRNFHAISGDIIKDFCNNFLNAACFSCARKKEFMANTRLSRDILEYKRKFNRALPDRVTAFVAARVFRNEMTDQFPDKPGYQIFDSYENRKTLFSAFEDGNDSLAHRHGIEKIPAVSDISNPVYPGLQPDIEQKIAAVFAREMDRSINRLEIWIRWVLQFAMKLPGGKRMLSPLRAIQRIMRLKFSGW